MKTITQKISLSLILLMAMMVCKPSQAQTIATPTAYTSLSAGSQTLTGVSLTGTESWLRWTCGDGITKLDAKVTQQGSTYQSSSAEFYLPVSTDSIQRVYVDSLNSDSTLHLVAGYLNAGDTIFIRFVNLSGSCGSCVYANPLIDLTIFSTTGTCAPSIACSLVPNGGFEQATLNNCGVNVPNGAACWYKYENTSDLFRRGCNAGGGRFNLGTNTWSSNPVINSHNPFNNNAVAGFYVETNILSNIYYTESIGAPLISPLIPGHSYQLSFWAYNHQGALNSMAMNPEGHPCWVNFSTSPVIVTSPSPNPGAYPSFPAALNLLQDFAVAPLNTWTYYTHTFTFNGPTASVLLVGPDVYKNYLYGYNNRTDNPYQYIALDDINIIETTPLTATSTTICAGQTGTLTASGMSSYVWQPGNTTGASIPVNPIVTTVYTVTGTNSGGCVQTQTTTVTVKPLPDISVVPGASVGICPGSSVTLSAIGASTYTWAPCSLPSNCNTNALVVSPSVNTTYTVTGTSAGCSNMATVSVYSLNPTNSINISGYTILCPGESAYLSASGATNYTWSPCVSGCNSATLAPSPGATTTYTVRGINACGVLSTSTVVVSVKPTYPVDPAVLSNPVCPGYSVSLIANGGSPYSYTWTPGNIVGTMITVSPSVTTTYTACTNVPGCPDNCAPVTVTIMPVPQLTLTPASFSICAGTATTISVSGASSYTWSTGDTGPVVVVTPTAATVYTVSGSVYSCPTLTASASAYVYPDLSIGSSPNVITCPGANTALFAYGGTGSYSWSPGGATSSSVAVSPTVPTVYTLTSAAPGCTLSATALVNPVSCCSVTTAVTFTATSGTVNSGVYNLNSALVLTGDLTLDNLTIFMGSHAEIIVPNNIHFTLNQCHLLGCPQMWKGIRFLGPNGSIDVTKNSLIEDAITAVDVSAVTGPANSSAIFFIETSTFNKNHTAISAATYNTNSGNYPMFLHANVFTSRKLYTPDHQLMNPSLPLVYNWPTATTTSLKGFASLASTFTPDIHLSTGNQFSIGTYSSSAMEIPNSGSVSHQGVRVKDIYSTNGNTNGFRMTAFEGNPYVYGDQFEYYNVFDNMHFGVNAENTNLLVAHAAFQNMSQFEAGSGGGFIPLKYYDGGMGINSISTMANGLAGSQTFLLAVGPIVSGSYNRSTNFFINNPYGVKAENIQNVTVNFNVFHSSRVYSGSSIQQFNAPVDKGEYGVYVKSLDYRTVNIKRNFTANINNGIVFLANANNLFGNLYAQYIGAVSIQNNNLKANYGGVVTAGQSMRQGIAVDNLLSPYQLLLDGNNLPVTVSNNTIDRAFSGISASNWNRQRVITNANTITLADNGMNNSSQYGIRHQNNLGDNLIGNDVKGFNTTKQRVYAIMANENKGQSFWCNYTENSYHGAVFGGSQNLTNWKNNSMKLHQRAMMLDNTTIGQQGATGQPIDNNWNSTWSGAYKLYVTGMDPGTANGNSKLYMSNLPTSIESEANPFAFRYKTTAPQSLFYTTGSSGISCPYSLPSNPEPAQFSGYQPNLHDIVSDAYDYASYLAGNRKNGRLAVYRILLEDSTLLTADTVLQNFKASGDSGNIGKFFAVEQKLSEADYSNAEGLLAAISPADSAEAVLKHMYRIYMRSRSGSYSVADESHLTELANGCPAQLGIGVYQARVLLNSIYDVYFQYESDCGDTNQVAYRKARGNDELLNTSDNSSFVVYPNPSSGLVYFTASGMGIESYQIIVYDITGKAIFRKDYTDGEKVNSIDLNLSNGIYLIQLTNDSNGEIHKQKFVIQK